MFNCVHYMLKFVIMIINILYLWIYYQMKIKISRDIYIIAGIIILSTVLALIIKNIFGNVKPIIVAEPTVQQKIDLIIKELDQKRDQNIQNLVKDISEKETIIWEYNNKIEITNQKIKDYNESISILSWEIEYITTCKSILEKQKGKVEPIQGCNDIVIEKILPATVVTGIINQKVIEYNTWFEEKTLNILKTWIEWLNCRNIKWLKNSQGQSQDCVPLNSNWIEDRSKELLSIYWRENYDTWNKIAKFHKITTPMLICIAKADSNLWMALKTTNNIGNVGNNDRGNTAYYAVIESWIEAIAKTLNNTYLWKKLTVNELTPYWCPTCKKNYATSRENRAINVQNCLTNLYETTIYWTYKFRTQ